MPLARDRVLDQLASAYACGLLSDDSLEHRVGAALQARSEQTLRGTLWDLPEAPPSALERRWRQLLAWWREDEQAGLRVGELWLACDQPRAQWVVGRSGACDAQVADLSVSRRHARVSLRGGRWSVTDLGSANGTWVNGCEVQQATLRRGDRLRFGELRAELL